MMPITIHKAIEIKAPIARVWRYVGTEEGLRQWWGFNIRLEAKQGGCCEERSLFNGKRLDLVGEVTVYDPPRQLVLRLRPKDEAERWPNFTTIAIRLKESEGRTLVTLDHQAFGALVAESVLDWVVPTTPTTKPERSPILNRLPAAQPTLVRDPTGLHSGAPMPLQPSFQIHEMIWQRISEARWESSLAQLCQITDEEQGDKTL